MIGLAKTSAPPFKKQPGRLPKLAALDMLVFFKIVKMVFSETVARYHDNRKIRKKRKNNLKI